MKRKTKIKLIIDLSMATMIVSCYAYRITGNVAHEIIGLSLFTMFLAHQLVNWRWYKAVFKGRYNILRIIKTSVNISLLVLLFTILLSGLLNSRVVLGFLKLDGSMMLRQIHTTAAYWLMVTVSLHTGLYWNNLIYNLKRITGITYNKKITKTVTRIVVVLIVIFGIWSFLERDIISKLIHGFAFDFWDEEKPDALFFAETVSIMGIFTLTGYSIMKIMRINRNRRKNQ